MRNGTTTLFSLSSLLSSIFEIFTDFGDSDFWNSHPDWQAAIGSDLSLTLSKESSQPKTIWINGYNTTLSYFLKRNPPRLSNRCPTKSRVIFMVLNSRMKKKNLLCLQFVIDSLSVWSFGLVTPSTRRKSRHPRSQLSTPFWKRLNDVKGGMSTNWINLC